MQATSTAPRVVTKIAANPLLASRHNPNRPLNVAAYCRVSTDAEDQINSYNAQMSYYRDKIMKNPKWRFVIFTRMKALQVHLLKNVMISFVCSGCKRAG